MKYLYVFNLFIFCNSVIKFYFKKKYNSNSMNETFDYYQYLVNNDLITELIIGSPPQIIPITLKYNMESFYLTKPSSQGIFNSNNSKTFFSNFKEIKLTTEELEKGYIAKENIIFNFQNKNNKIIQKPISDIFFLYITKPNASIINSGNIGLTYTSFSDYKNLNIIIQLKKKDLIEHFTFQFNYLNETNGELFIGEYPHEYNKSFYDKFDFYHIKINFGGLWYSYFDYISYGNFTSNIKTYFYLNSTLGGIIGNRFFLNSIEKLFFHNKEFTKGKCKINYKYDYTFYNCDIDVNLKHFQNLSFYSKELNYTFILSYEDLFEFINGKYFCKLIFKEDTSSNIYLGQPFLKKYMFIFDNDRKLFGFYIKIKEKENFLSLFTIMIIVLLLIIMILSIILIRYIYKKPRRIRANELEEDIDYTPFSG